MAGEDAAQEGRRVTNDEWCGACRKRPCACRAAEAERRLKIYSEVCKLCAAGWPERLFAESDSNRGWVLPAGYVGHSTNGVFEMCQANALKRLHAERDKAAT